MRHLKLFTPLVIGPRIITQKAIPQTGQHNRIDKILSNWDVFFEKYAKLMRRFVENIPYFYE